MRTLASFPRLQIEIEREEIEVTMMSPSKVPDEKWRFVDGAGHGHFWSGKELPTLEWVVTGTEWVGDEFEAEEIEVGEHRCPLCSEVVEPGRRLEYPKSVLGPTTVVVTIDGERFVMDPERYARSVKVWAEWLRKR